MSQRPNRLSTEEMVGPSSVKRILVTVLGTLTMVFLFNFAAIWLLADYNPGGGVELVRTKWKMLLDIDQPVDWLILGDSSGAAGVVPSILNERMEVTSINLCTHGAMGTIDDAWMLDTYIERFGSPRNVLIVHVPWIWRFPGPRLWEVSKVPLAWGYWNHVQPPLELSLGEAWEVFLTRYAPIYSKDVTLRDVLKHPWHYFDRAELEKDGLWVISEPAPLSVEIHTEQVLSSMEETPFELSALNEEVLEHIAALVEEHRFHVYIANGPVYEGLYDSEVYQIYLAQMQDMLTAFADSSEWLHYISREQMTFPKDQMGDADHLVYPAALVYTDSLVTEIISQQDSTE